MTVVTGVQGDQGEKGDKGDKGDTGDVGPRGYTGPSIVPSVDIDGVMHFSVQDTATAPQSVSVRGPQGPQGVQGAQGEQGARGPQGIQGVQGVQGPVGPQGERGPEGVAGAQGPTGPQGERGADGADGRSFVLQDVFETLGALKSAYPTGNEFAYQVISEGREVFIWSENANDWVSVGALQGPVGPAGPQGATGPEGPQGPAGPQGVQGVQGIQGAIGPEGPQGPAGVSGKDGQSAYAAAAANGYSGTETTFNNSLVAMPSHIGDKSNPHGVTVSQIAYLGSNPITTPADDTSANWKTLGTGYAWYSKLDQLNNQPSQYGMLLSIVQGEEVTQIWKSHASGGMFIRSGNGSGWGEEFAKVYDSLRKPTASDIGAAPSSHSHSASDITSGVLSVANGGTGARTFTSGEALIGAGTGAVTTRTIRNTTTASSAITADTALITSNTLRYALNRTSGVAAANTAYTTLMARGTSLNNAETTPAVNGAIAWNYG